jgi:hypothetical protein
VTLPGRPPLSGASLGMAYTRACVSRVSRADEKVSPGPPHPPAATTARLKSRSKAGASDCRLDSSPEPDRLATAATPPCPRSNSTRRTKEPLASLPAKGASEGPLNSNNAGQQPDRSGPLGDGVSRGMLHAGVIRRFKEQAPWEGRVKRQTENGARPQRTPTR